MRTGWLRGVRARLAGVAAVVTIAAIVQVHALFVERSGVAVNPPTAPEAFTPEVAGWLSLSQSFRLSAEGFDGVVVYAKRAGEQAAGEVVFELSVRDGETDVPLARVVRPARDVAGRRAFLVPFPVVDRPRGHLYTLTISMPNIAAGSGLVFRMVEADRYVQGVATIGDREIWGDLAFETRAEKAILWHRLEDMLAVYPPPFRSPWLVVALLLAFDVLLGWAAWRAFTSPLTGESPSTDAPDPAVRAGIRRAAIASLAVLALLGAVHWWQRERVVIDLVDEFPRARAQTSMASLHEGFSLQPAGIDGLARRCIQALPFGRITFTVTAPPGAEFAVWAGMRPDVWLGPGDGATFRAGVSLDGVYQEYYRRHFLPAGRPADRTWHAVRLDLARYAGRQVDIVLNTEPSFNAVGDAALWCEPRVRTK